MTTKEIIIKKAKSGKTLRTSELVKELKISRQTIAAYLKGMVEAGVLTKEGATHNAAYRYANKKNLLKKTKILKLIKILEGLQEDRVFEEVKLKMGLKDYLSKSVEAIVFYGFTEMLNNAIDHSRSRQVEVHTWLDKGKYYFEIRDFGIGIFENLRKGLHLKNELEASEQLLKGKQTTLPERHSGEGIFFTSKIADCFAIRSHNIKLTINNDFGDIFFAEERYFRGTGVYFSIRRQSRKMLNNIFNKYSKSEFKFDKNIIRLKTFLRSGLISRSQARRITAGLEKFSHVVFDFDGLKEIGQAFADEIFRVFKNRHSEVKLSYINAPPAVEFMIKRTSNTNLT